MFSEGFSGWFNMLVKGTVKDQLSEEKDRVFSIHT